LSARTRREKSDPDSFAAKDLCVVEADWVSGIKVFARLSPRGRFRESLVKWQLRKKLYQQSQQTLKRRQLPQGCELSQCGARALESPATNASSFRERPAISLPPNIFEVASQLARALQRFEFLLVRRHCDQAVHYFRQHLQRTIDIFIGIITTERKADGSLRRRVRNIHRP